MSLENYKNFIVSKYLYSDINIETQNDIKDSLRSEFLELTFHPLTPQLLHDVAQNYSFNISEFNNPEVQMYLNSEILDLPWDWKKLHTHPNFVWHIILYYSEKLDKDAIHLYSKLNWRFVFDYRNHPFWDWDKLSSRADSFKFMKKCKNMPWRWEPMIRTFDTDPEFWDYICKNYNSIPKSVFKKLSSNINFPFEILSKSFSNSKNYMNVRDLWDWKSISKLEHLKINFIKDNTNLPWNWEIIQSRF